MPITARWLVLSSSAAASIFSRGLAHLAVLSRRLRQAIALRREGLSASARLEFLVGDMTSISPRQATPLQVVSQEHVRAHDECFFDASRDAECAIKRAAPTPRRQYHQRIRQCTRHRP